MIATTTKKHMNLDTIIIRISAPMKVQDISDNFVVSILESRNMGAREKPRDKKIKFSLQ